MSTIILLAHAGGALIDYDHCSFDSIIGLP
jgi:hypothetical protein